MPTESFFTQASLAYLASAGAGKDGKTYSMKPTDGTGDFTFSRGSNLAATRVGADGLIEKGRENLLVQSNQFDTTWSKQSVSVTSGQSGYDGSSDAWILESSIIGGYIRQYKSTSGVNSFSIYAKANSTDGIALRLVGITNNPYIYFDLTNGDLLSQSVSTDIINVNDSESLGGGWYRFSVSYKGSLTQVRMYPSDTSTTQVIGSIYIQDAQVEIGLAATDYIESGASTGKAGLLEDEPRFDYSGGATCPSLLLEPSRTNLIPQSEYLTNNNSFSSINVTLESGFYESPEGLSNAYKWTTTNPNSNAFVDLGRFNTTIGTTYSFSFYLKSDASNVNVKCSFTRGTTEQIIAELTTEWKRFDITFTADNSDKDFLILLGDYGITNPAQTIFVYGIMQEAGSYPTSYIPNHSGGTITRGDDFIVNSNDLTGLFGSDEGAFYFETDNTIFKGEDSNNNYLGFLESSSGNYFRFRGSDTSILVQSIGYGSNISFNPSGATLTKYLYKWEGSTIKLFVDGVERGSVSQTATFNPDTFRAAGGSSFYTIKTNLKQMLVFTEALSDADCITLTTI